MAMSVESITKVKDERTYLLLSEPKFNVVGREFELLSESELKRRIVVPTAGVDAEDISSEGTSIPRAVCTMVKYIKDGIQFDLENPREAKLVFTIVDHFLQAQSRLIGKRLGGLRSDMAEDFEHLTELANKMLEDISLMDRVDLMNAPKVTAKRYNSVFDLALGNKADANIIPTEYNPEPDDGKYKSPFHTVLNGRRYVNRTNRFN